MARTLLHFLTYGMLIGISIQVALIGKNVRYAQEGEFTFVASIALRNQQRNLSFEIDHLCTGALLSRKNVLTAGHCLIDMNIEDIEILVGSVNFYLAKTYYPESWITYDKWNSGVDVTERSYHDIAIITLKGEGVESTKIKPAPVLTFSHSDLYNSKIRIAGWGVSEDGKLPAVLQTAVLKVISNEECESRMEKLLGIEFVSSPDYLCSIAEPWILATCGDSGAPVINKQKQIVAVTVGNCPDLHGYNSDFRHQNLVNTHLNLHNYRYFIKDIVK